MATKTTNYNLTKPSGNENADIDVINANMDTIDSALSNKADKSQIPDVSGFATKSELTNGLSGKASTSVATTSANGLMSSTDKSKLDGIESGANKTVVDSALSSSSTNPVQNNVINSALAGKLPNYVNTISMTNAGNPRQVKFISVNYNTLATYFKMSAMCCHDNGVSYQFLEDIIIGVTTSGTVTCNVYKYCQAEVTLDNVVRNYGDVFYTIDTTNKVVDFYILIGQYSVSQYTPPTKIGNTTIAYVTPMTGGAVYYSSGDKVWANGNSATYVTTKDIPDTSKMMTTDTAQTITGAKAFTGQVGNTQSSAGVYLGLDTNASAPNANIAIVSANTASYIDMGAPNEDYGFRIIKWKGTSSDLAQFTYGGGGTITVPNATGTIALTSQIPNITASTSDIGEGSSLTTGALYLVYE